MVHSRAWRQLPPRGNTLAPGTTIEIEVDSLEQLDQALECSPDIILVDNFGPKELAEAVRRRDARAPRLQIEASGGVNLAISARPGSKRASIASASARSRTPPPHST